MRKNWDKISDIPNEMYCACLAETFTAQNRSGGPIKKESCRLLGKSRGGNNLVVVMGVFRETNIERYIIRVPANGTPELWQEEDKYMMIRSVQLVQHIRRNTNVPIPTVVAYCTEFYTSYQCALDAYGYASRSTCVLNLV